MNCPLPLKNLDITHRFPQCSGYHVRLTRERSLVRNQAETTLIGILILGPPCDSDSKEYACNVRDPGLIPGLGRSPGEGNETQQIQDDTQKNKNQQLRDLRTRGKTQQRVSSLGFLNASHISWTEICKSIQPATSSKY